MKIRNSFVSNSSSSSFILCGVAFDNFKEFIKNLCKDNPELYQKYENEEVDWYDVLEEKVKEPLEFETGGYDGDIDEVAVGINPNKMKDDQTLSQFKEEVNKSLNECGIISNISDVKFISGGHDAGGNSWIENRG